MMIPFLRRNYARAVKWIDDTYDKSPQHAIYVECVGGILGFVIVGAVVVLIIILTNQP